MPQVIPDGIATVALDDLAAAAAALTPGEHSSARCFVPEHDGAPAESAVRAQLGSAGQDLDLLLGVHAVHDVVEHSFRRAVAGEIDAAAAEREAAALRSSGATRVVHCTVVVARAAEPRAPVTVRVQAGPAASPHDLEGVLARAAAPPRVSSERLDELRPRLAMDARLQITHVAGGDGWAPTGCTVTLDHPVRRTLEAGTNLARLLGSCDGRQTARALLEQFAADADPRDDLTAERFAEVLQRLAADGYVVLDPPSE